MWSSLFVQNLITTVPKGLLARYEDDKVVGYLQWWTTAPESACWQHPDAARGPLVSPSQLNLTHILPPVTWQQRGHFSRHPRHKINQNSEVLSWKANCRVGRYYLDFIKQVKCIVRRTYLANYFGIHSLVRTCNGCTSDIEQPPGGTLQKWKCIEILKNPT